MPDAELLSASPYLNALNHKSAAIRAQAAIELGQKLTNANVGEDRDSVLRITLALTQILKQDPESSVRASAAIALRTTQDLAAKAALKQALENDPSAEVRFSIASSQWNLRGNGGFSEDDVMLIKQRIPILLEAVQKSKDIQVRQFALDALGTIATGAIQEESSGSKSNKPQQLLDLSTFVTLVSRTLNEDSSSTVRTAAAECLAKAQRYSALIVPILIDSYHQQTDRTVKLAIIEAISGFENDAKQAIPLLESLAKNNADKVTQEKALFGLSRVDENNKVVRTLASGILEQRKSESEIKLAISLLASNVGEKEPLLSPILQIFSTSKDQETRLCAAAALGMFSLKSKSKEATGVLVDALLHDNDLTMRLKIAQMFGHRSESEGQKREQIDCDRIKDGYSLIPETVQGTFEPMVEQVFPALLSSLKNEKEAKVREVVIRSMSRFYSEMKSIIEALEWSIRNDTDLEVRAAAVNEISTFKSQAARTLPLLLVYLQQYRPSNSPSDFRLGSEIEAICLALQDRLNDLSKPELNQTIQNLEKLLSFEKSWRTQQQSTRTLSWNRESKIEVIARTLSALKARQSAERAESEVLAKWAKNHIWIPCLLLLPGIYLIILFVRPLLLLLLPASLTLPKIGKISPKILLWLKYRPRVLDAWTLHYLGPSQLDSDELSRARVRFWESATAHQHQVYIPLPLRLSTPQSTRYETLPLAELQQIFRENTVQFLIQGEGGMGKTSIACQLARLAMIEQPNDRLCKEHPLFPVLIDPELIEQELRCAGASAPKSSETEQASPNPANSPLLEAIRKQVQFLINEQEPIQEELLKQLLQSGRILVLVDRLSEMSDRARQTIDPNAKACLMNALVIISRQNETIHNIQPDVIEPLQLTGSELMRFMEEYLRQTQAIELSHQPKLYQACENLQMIVETRGSRSVVTVLLAKLAVDQLIAGRSLPTSIPNLFTVTIELLNDQIQTKSHKPDSRAVIRDLGLIAWMCLQSTYRPNATASTPILESLKKLDAKIDPMQRLNYLVKDLRVVEQTGADRSQIRLVLDPMAEYLAALHLIESYGNNGQSWKKFANRAKEFERTAIQGFIDAVRDCAQVAQSEGRLSSTIVAVLSE